MDVLVVGHARPPVRKTAPNLGSFPLATDGTARAVTPMLGLVMSLCAPACLLPLDTDVSVPVCVPSIESPRTTSTPLLNRITRIETSPQEPSELEQVFEVEIRDCNEQQTLEYRVALNVEPNNPSIADVIDLGRIPASQRDPFSFTLSLGPPVNLNSCNKVQLFVAGSFANDDARDPFRTTIPGDLASATWFLEVVEFPTDVADFQDCRR